MREIKHRFEGGCNTIHQYLPDGEFHAGVNVVLHMLEGETFPRCAEVFSDDQEEYADIGLWFENNELSDYDGCFALPNEVIVLLRASGFTVDKEFQDDDTEILPTMRAEDIDSNKVETNK